MSDSDKKQLVQTPHSLPQGLRHGLFGLGLFTEAEWAQRDFSDTGLEDKYEPQGGVREWDAYIKEALVSVYAPPSGSATLKERESPLFMLTRGKRGKVVVLDEEPAPVMETFLILITFFGALTLFEHTMIHVDDIEDQKGTLIALWAAYILLGGWILSPIMNIIKIFTELVPKLLAEFSACIRHSIDNPVLAFLPAVFHVGFELIYIVMRMVTSPVESVKAGINSGYGEGWSLFLGAASIVGSLSLWTAIALVAGPLLLLSLSTKLGISLSTLSHSGFLTSFSSPVMAFLTTQLHFAATTALTGAVALSTIVLTLLGLNELRNGLSELLIEAKTSKGDSCFSSLSFSSR